MNAVWLRSSLLVFASVLAGVSCETKDAPPAAPSARPEAARSAEKPEPPWYVGTWTGGYEAERHVIDASRRAAQPGWQQDDGGAAAGAGTIELSIDDDGSATGKSSGPLGDLTITGKLIDQTLRVQLVPKLTEASTAFNGFLLARRNGNKFEGRLNASTGDGNLVRKAEVELTKR